MIRFHSIIALIFIQSSLISTFPVSSSLLKSVKERAVSCSLFDTDPSCSSNGYNFYSFTKAEIGGGISPDGTASNDGVDSFGSSAQISLVDDLSMPSSDTEIFAAGNLNSDASQSPTAEAGSKPEPNVFFDYFPGEGMTDQAEIVASYDLNAAHPGEISPSPRPLPVIWTYICEEFGETCAQYKDGVSTGIIRYTKCNSKDQLCRLCDRKTQECDPDAGWDRQAIPSPDNPWGQPWNHCRNKQCGPCETAAGWLGYLSLGIIPWCGPPKFD